MSSSIKQCPECHSVNLTINQEKGEVICRNCGLVIEDRLIDFYQEWREFDHDQASKRRRTGAPMTYSVDYNEPIIIHEDKKIRVVKIGQFVDNIIEKSRNVKKEGSVEYANISPGKKAVCFDRNYHIKFKGIGEVSRHPVKEMYDIRLELGKNVKVTGAHSVFTVKNSMIVPTKVSDLQEGQFIVAPLYLPSVIHPEMELKILDEFFKLSGKHTNIYVRGIKDDWLFLKARQVLPKMDVDARQIKDWKRHSTMPLWALRNIFDVYEPLEFDFSGSSIGIYSGPNVLPLSIPITERFCKLLGYYASEGHCTEHSVVFSFGAHETAYIEEVKQLANEIFGMKAKEYPKGSAVQIEIRSKLLSMLFRDVLMAGSCARQKRVPELVYSLPENMKKAFLKAYINGDGCLFYKENAGNSTNSACFNLFCQQRAEQ